MNNRIGADLSRASRFMKASAVERYAQQRARWVSVPVYAAFALSAASAGAQTWQPGASSNAATTPGALVPNLNTSISVGQILQQAANAAATLNYTGTITYQRRGAAETSRIVHLFENGVEMERISSLDGPPFEVVRVNDELTCYIPDARVMRIEPRTGRQGFPSLLPRQMTTLSQHFSVKKLEIERVAGQDAQVWLFEPNDEFRFWHKLWTELKTGLWLRGRVLDERGTVIEEITFSDIQIGGKISREQVKPTLANSITNWRIDRALPFSGVKIDTGWMAKALPAGFVKVRETFMRTLPGRTEPVSQLVYSDGLSSVSVYAAPLSAGETAAVGASVQGSHQVFTRQSNYQLITAFGEARPATVKAIANGLVRK